MAGGAILHSANLRIREGVLPSSSIEQSRVAWAQKIRHRSRPAVMTHPVEPLHWQRVKDLFDALVSLPPDEQDRAIGSLDNEESWVRHEVERLLTHARRDTVSILNKRAVDLLPLRSP